MRDITISNHESLVSFNVTSLFTNVPFRKAVEVIHGKLWEDDDLIERTPYFSSGGDFYEQREGTAMGSPVSAVVADLYMGFLRSWLLSRHLLDPVFGSCMWMTHAASLGLEGSSITLTAYDLP